VVLAWDAVLNGLRNPRDGHDTVVHELAHVLDRADGSFDGAPALRAGEHYRPWASVMQRHFERLRRRDRRLGKVLRDYGATNEAEFFAVSTEVYFERPDELRRRAPALFAELERFYTGQS
jgi:Mlc titration factor MtfA (ptsG expression regulator)